MFEELHPGAVKTGMLLTAENVRIVATFFRTPHSALRIPYLVVDPVLVSTSGARLLQPAAEKILCEKLLPLATLVTPNLDEAEILTGQSQSRRLKICGPPREKFIRVSAARFSSRAAICTSAREAMDIFFDGKNGTASLRAVRETASPRTAPAAPIPPRFAPRWRSANDLPQAVEIGKQFHHARPLPAAIASGNHFALGHFPGPHKRAKAQS